MDDCRDDHEISAEHVEHAQQPNEVSVEHDVDQLDVLDLERIADETEEHEACDELESSEHESYERDAMTEVCASNWEESNVMTEKVD